GIEPAVYGAADKLAATAELMRTLNVGWDTLAAMGDDWPDLPLLQRAAFACAPANAHIEVRALAHHVTRSRGGHGPARECCDLLLMAAGRSRSRRAAEPRFDVQRRQVARRSALRNRADAGPGARAAAAAGRADAPALDEPRARHRLHLPAGAADGRARAWHLVAREEH